MRVSKILWCLKWTDALVILTLVSTWKQELYICKIVKSEVVSRLYFFKKGNISGNIYCMPGCIIGSHWVSVTIRSPLIHGLIEHCEIQAVSWYVWLVHQWGGERLFNKWWHLFICMKEEMRLVTLFLVFETTSSRWSQNRKMWFGKVANHLADNRGESLRDLRRREIF